MIDKGNRAKESKIKTNEKYVPGESIDEHKNLEDANSFVSKKEIGQQNENL